jgi:molecular chaperone DnaJ
MTAVADPFEVLGLEPGCSEDDVRKAFRKAAQACHPDAPGARGDPEAAERFRACVEARDTLVDPVARAEAANQRRRRHARPGGPTAFGGGFDAFFDNIDRNGRGADQSAGRARRGTDVEREIRLSLEQAFSGGSFVLGGTPGPCKACSGDGTVPSQVPQACKACRGVGKTRQTKGFISVSVECAGCGGTGRTRRVDCPSCGGEGRTHGGGTPYEVPPGARDGMVNVLRGYGAPGYAGGPRGDMRLTYRIKPHATFGRDGADLLACLAIPVWDAALGCSRRIPGIDGEPLVVEVPPGTAAGTVIAFPGRGMPTFPGRGEVRVEIGVTVPAPSTPRMREALMRLRDAYAETEAGGAR